MTGTRGRIAILLTLCGLSGLILFSLSCRPEHEGSRRGPPGAQVERYGVLRTGNLLVRFDSATGQVWIVSTSGDGGWVRVGKRASGSGEDTHPGRYRVHTVPAAKAAGTVRSGRPHLLRVDRATGRAWIVEASRGKDWQELPDVRVPAGREGSQS